MAQGIKHLPESIFQSKSNKIKKLYLSNNNLCELHPDTFKNLDKLETLSISKNYLNSLPQGIFDDLVQLKYLFLNNNHIKEFKRGIFDNLPNLQRLNLGDNPLSNLPEDLLTNQKKLKTLELYNCNIRSINNHAFRALDNLEICRLEDNKIAILPKNIFEDSPHLYFIDLTNNPIFDGGGEFWYKERVPDIRRDTICDDEDEDIYVLNEKRIEYLTV